MIFIQGNYPFSEVRSFYVARTSRSERRENKHGHNNKVGYARCSL